MEAFRHNIQPEALPSVDVFTRVIAVSGGSMIGNPTFIQPGAPAHSGPYQWWDTSTAVLTLWVEDGV